MTVIVVFISMTIIVGCSNNTTESTNNESQTNASDSKGTINIGEVTWAEDVAVSNLWKVLLEDQGYDVKLTQLDLAPLYVGLNKGDINIFLDAWLPTTQQAYWSQYQSNLDDYGSWYEDAKIGIVVPKYVDINSIEDLEANKDKFSGKIIGIDPGAGIMKAGGMACSDYSLNDFKIIQGSEAAMISSLEKAYNNGEWIAITSWSPHWIFTKYDLKFLADPKNSFGNSEKLHMVGNKDFAAQYPEITEKIKRFKMTDKQIGSLEELITNGMDPQEAAKKWINENQDVVNIWIE